MSDYKKMFEQALLNQGATKDPIQEQYEAQLTQPQGQDWSPTVKLLDSYAGTNAASTLPKQESTKEKLAQLLQLRQGTQNTKLKGLQALAQMQGQSEDKAAQRAFQQQMYGLQLAKAKMKAGAAPKIGSEEKQKLGYTTTLLKELPKLRAMYEQDTGSIRPGMAQVFGQNEVERVAGALAENYGRLQSGGAISKDEESRFLSRLGSMMDSKEIRLAKLKQIEEEIMDKHNIFGGGSIGGAQRAPTGGNAGHDLHNMSIEELELLDSSL